MKDPIFILNRSTLKYAMTSPLVKKQLGQYCVSPSDRNLLLVVNSMEMVFASVQPDLSDLKVSVTGLRGKKLMEAIKDTEGWEKIVQEAIVEVKVNHPIRPNKFAEAIPPTHRHFKSVLILSTEVNNLHQAYIKEGGTSLSSPHHFATQIVNWGVAAPHFPNAWNPANISGAMEHIQSQLSQVLMVDTDPDPEMTDKMTKEFIENFEIVTSESFYSNPVFRARFIQACNVLRILRKGRDNHIAHVPNWVQAQYFAYLEMNKGQEVQSAKNLPIAIGFLVGKKKDDTYSSSLRFKRFVEDRKAYLEGLTNKGPVKTYSAKDFLAGF